MTSQPYTLFDSQNTSKSLIVTNDDSTTPYNSTNGFKISRTTLTRELEAAEVTNYYFNPSVVLYLISGHICTLKVNNDENEYADIFLGMFTKFVEGTPEQIDFAQTPLYLDIYTLQCIVLPKTPAPDPLRFMQIFNKTNNVKIFFFITQDSYVVYGYNDNNNSLNSIAPNHYILPEIMSLTAKNGGGYVFSYSTLFILNTALTQNGTSIKETLGSFKRDLLNIISPSVLYNIFGDQYPVGPDVNFIKQLYDMKKVLIELLQRCAYVDSNDTTDEATLAYDRIINTITTSK